MTHNAVKTSADRSQVSAVETAEMELVEQLLTRMQQGEVVDLEALSAQHPEFSDCLAGYVESLRFLQAADSEVSQFCDVAAHERPSGQQIGDYRIIREVGRGGMGIVYEARQISLDRQVALKVLPFAAVLDQQQTARFLVEAHAAAQLHHENIVPVYAIGQEQSVHYYSMQFIAGAPLDQIIEELRQFGGRRRLPDIKRSSSSGTSPTATPSSGFSTSQEIHERSFQEAAVNLAIQAADALHHAHSLGVVHRDIKPSNLLVDGAGKLWVTDFSLARCDTGSNITLTGAVIGTIHYMSPEQAMGRTRLVDRRSDVYSLGITLYELLTLRKAFSDTDRERSLRRIERSDPAAPRRHNAAIPIDLETIILKAIAKRRRQRYASAGELADDLRRFLAGRPIAARRPTVTDRIGKWANRHRSLVACVTALLFISLLGTAVSAVLIARQQYQTQLALQEARENHRRSLEHFRQARAVVDRFGVQLSERLATIPGTEKVRLDLLQDTLRYHKQFAAQAAHDATLRADLATAQFKAGEILDHLGGSSASLASYEAACRLLEQLVSQEPAAAGRRFELATCYNNIGLHCGRRGDLKRAAESYAKALALQTELLAEEPDRIEFRRSLALIYGNLGTLWADRDQAAAADHYARAIELQAPLAQSESATSQLRNDLAMNYNNLCFLYRRTSPPRAIDYGEQAVSTLRQLVAQEDSGQLGYRADLALSLNNLGTLLTSTGDSTRAQAAFEEAISLSEQLVAAAPAVVRYRRDLAVWYNNLGRLFNQLGQPQDARRVLQVAADLMRDLAGQLPDDEFVQSSLGGILNNLAFSMEALDDPQTLSTYSQAVAQLGRATSPTIPQPVRVAHETSRRNLARLLAAKGQDAAAQRVLADLPPALPASPTTSD